MRFFLIIVIIITTIFCPLKKGFSLPLADDFFFSGEGDVILNQKNKTIITNNKVFFINDGNKYAADKLSVWYQDLNKLDLDHINRIEASGNVQITTNKNQKITGDRYVYSLVAAAHVLQSITHPVIYKDDLRTLTSKDRIEYFVKEDIIVIRGHPKVIGKTNPDSSTYYHFSANLINVKLIDSNTNLSTSGNNIASPLNKNATNSTSSKKSIEFAEAIGNVTFSETDTTIKAGYAIYYKEQNQIEFYNNVVFSNKEGKLTGCSAIYNLNLGYGKIIPCSKKSGLSGTYQPKQRITK